MFDVYVSSNYPIPRLNSLDRKIKVYERAIGDTDVMIKKAIASKDIVLKKFKRLATIWESLTVDNTKLILEELRSSDEYTQANTTPKKEKSLIKYAAKVHVYRLYSYSNPESKFYVPFEANENWQYWKAIFMNSIDKNKNVAMNRLFDSVVKKILLSKDYTPNRVANISDYEILKGAANWKEGDRVKVLYLQNAS